MWFSVSVFEGEVTGSETVSDVALEVPALVRANAQGCCPHLSSLKKLESRISEIVDSYMGNDSSVDKTVLFEKAELKFNQIFDACFDSRRWLHGGRRASEPNTWSTKSRT